MSQVNILKEEVLFLDRFIWYNCGLYFSNCVNQFVQSKKQTEQKISCNYEEAEFFIIYVKTEFSPVITKQLSSLWCSCLKHLLRLKHTKDLKWNSCRRSIIKNAGGNSQLLALIQKVPDSFWRYKSSQKPEHTKVGVLLPHLLPHFQHTTPFPTVKIMLFSCECTGIFMLDFWANCITWLNLSRQQLLMPEKSIHHISLI